MKQVSFSIILSFLSFFCSAQPAKTLRLLKSGKLQEAIDLTKEKEDKYRNPIKYHLFLARGYTQIGNDIEAEKEYLKAFELVQEKSKKLQLMDFDVADELSLLRVRTGNWEGARNLIDWSLTTRSYGWNKKNPTNFRPYLPLATLYFSQEQTDSAKHYLSTYTKNLRNSNYTGHLDVDKYADAYQSMAEIALDEGDLKTARKYANKSSRLQRHEWTRKEVGKNFPDRVIALNTLTSIYLQGGKYKMAEKMDRKATYLLEKHLQGQDLLQTRVYLNKALLAYQNNEIEEVKAHLQKVMQLKVRFVKTTYAYLSEYEKENSYTDFKKSNDEVLKLAFRILNQPDQREVGSFAADVFNFIINTKAVILSESNKLISNAGDSTGLLSEQLITWKDLKRQWYYLNAVSKKRSKEKASEVQLQIVELEKSLSSQLGIEPANDWKSIAKKLNANEMAIEFARVDFADSSATFLAFKIKKNSKAPEVVVLNSPISEEKFISYYNNAIKYDQEDTVTYSLFWNPLNIGADIKKVYLSPSGAFHKVNFNTLKNPNQTFLSDDYSLINISNTGNLAGVEESATVFSSAAVIGISDFSAYSANPEAVSLENLPGVLFEVQQVDSILNSSQIKTLTLLNENAQEATLTELPSQSILHLATHGFFDPKVSNPMLGSGLVFSSNDLLGDGILTAYEASLLNLEKTELVILSACASGLGGIVDGEGVYGLQRAFQVAGVQNIIMSMWNIDDDFTQYFMTTFYSSLLKTQDVPAAFQETLAKAKETNPNPRFWGAFKLVQFF